MRIIYITKARLPTEKAYGTNMVKTCEALAKAGVEVELLAPKCGNKNAPIDLFSYYGIQRIFSVRQLPIIDAISMGWWGGFWINHVSFLFSILFRNIGNKNKCVILARDELSAFFLKLKGYRVFYDMHGFPEKKRWFWKQVLRRIDGIIATNKWKVEQCVTLFGVTHKKIIVAPNGFDPSLFEFHESKEEVRDKLGLPRDVKIVMYTGHLYDWKGAHVLLETARIYNLQTTRLAKAEPRRTTYKLFFVFVGGTGKELEDFRKKANGLRNVLILGHKPYVEIPRYLKSADILVLPNSRVSKNARFAIYSQKDTSPIKLFEYMASGTPIVASDLPSIREIVNETSAVLVAPDNPAALNKGIEKIFYGGKFVKKIVMQARENSLKYTWDNRAEHIIQFMN